MIRSIIFCLALLLAQPGLYSQTLYRTSPPLPPDRTIRGDEHITYINNSPDTLRAPVIKLILNIHKPGAVRYGQTDSAYLTNGVVIDAFTQNGQARPFATSETVGTWRPFRLDKPLAPHDSVELTFKWHYQLSLESNREGMIDSTTYFLAYFYPRVAVYDDYNGWGRE